MTKRKKSPARSSSAKRARKSLDDVGTPTSPKGVVVDGGKSRNGNDLYWEMESIVGKRIFKGKVQYKVHWKGCTSEDDTWEPVSNLCDSAYKDALLYDKAAAAEREQTDKTPSTTSPKKKKKVASKMVHCLMVPGEAEKQERRPKKTSSKSLVKDETIVEVSAVKTNPATESTSDAAEIAPVVDGTENAATANVDAVKDDTVGKEDESDAPVNNVEPVPATSPDDGVNPVAASSEETAEGDTVRKDDEHEPVVDDVAPLPEASSVNEADKVVAPLQETDVGEGLKDDEGELVVADDEVPFPVI